MAGYKVSYKVLRQQGEALKAVAKLVDGYAERVGQVGGKLGDGEMLAQVRTNLQKLREQLGESRAVLNTAGECLSKSVESYSGVETRQVKKVDGMKAHQRDFYKNPVVVASAGGAAAGAATAAGMSAPAAAAPASSGAAAGLGALGGAASGAAALGGLNVKKVFDKKKEAAAAAAASADAYDPEAELEKAIQRLNALSADGAES
ncbi:MAG: hypothetical protein LBT74_11210 [Acidobacteriota bacterium]|jgi:hypothetical protein|nr:hypothetical protein [Acidobacteriota bacterium]